MKVEEVDCWEGYRAEEHPRAFTLGKDRYRVEEILDRWYSPDSDYFKVRASDGNVYILRNHCDSGWTLESYRRDT